MSNQAISLMRMSNIKCISEKSWLFIASFSLILAKSIQYLIYSSPAQDVFGWLDILGCLVCLITLLVFVRKFSKISCVLASVILLLDGIQSFIISGFEVQNLIEHSLMITMPLLYAFYSECKFYINFLKLVTALTFVGHGIYALGFWGVPSHFIEMVIHILPFNSSQATEFLFIVGLFDLIAAVLIFTKEKFVFYSIIYMITWGFLTSIARPIYLFNTNSVLGVIGFLQRVPHFIVPIVILKIYFLKRESHSSSLA